MPDRVRIHRSVRETSAALLVATLLVAPLLVALPRHAAAQTRLTGLWTLGTGVFGESYRFGRGLPQRSTGADSASIVTSAAQWVVPVTLAVPLGDRWSADVATVYTSGEVRLAAAAAAAEPMTATLAGLGDVRVRLTGRLVGDVVLLTLGGNLSTGVRGLGAGQLAALGVLGAPALGSALPAASAGPSATVGLVYALGAGAWSWALGAGVEVRGRYAPLAALTAGIPTPRFEPGTAAHLSLGTNGLLGDGALALTLTADAYAPDRLTAGGDSPDGAAIRLGPTLGADLQWRMVTGRFRELSFGVAERYRLPFSRDGWRVAGSAASYLAVGGRAAYAVGRRTELTTGLDLWRHGGLTVDRTLMTARTTSGAVSLGIARRLGAHALQPYLRLRAGDVDTGAGVSGVTGVGLGTTLTTRF